MVSMGTDGSSGGFADGGGGRGSGGGGGGREEGRIGRELEEPLERSKDW